MPLSHAQRGGILYLYISISREIQDAKGREALIWILPHHTYVAKLTPEYFASRDFDISEISPTRESNTNRFRGRQARYQLLHEAYFSIKCIVMIDIER